MNELDLLDIRLHELYDVVDRFVLVEATKTHSGLNKSLYYYENSDRFVKFSDKILHIIVEDMPTTPEEIQASLTSKDRKWIESKYQIEDSWVRERHQRNCMMRALQGRDPNDVVMLSDADEIVKRSVVEKIRTDGICEGSNAVHQSLNSFYLNVVCTNMEWYGSKIVKRKMLNEHTPSEVRFHVPASCTIEDGGWHYSWFGGAEKIKEKLQSYAHQEFNKPDLVDIEHIKDKLENKKDVLNRLYQYDKIDMNEDNTPKYVLDNLYKFKDLIYQGE